MRSTRLTPTEVLQKQKLRLRLKSNVLTEKLENDLNYVQHNIGTIITNSVVDAVVSKTPPLIQSLLGRNQNPETDRFDYWGLIEGVLDLLPVVIKGQKGWLVRLVLQQIGKFFFRKTV